MKTKHSPMTAIACVALLGGAFVPQANAEGTHKDGKEQAETLDQGTQPRAMEQTETEAAMDDGPDVEVSSVQLAQINADQLKVLQRKLQEQGYYHGEIDGKVGPQTRNALRRFYSQRAELARAGRIAPDSAEAFGVDAAEIERVRGEEPAQAKAPLRGDESEE